ncbi:MAG: molybdate ABC transporter substrate-binding protein [Deltaproteobacteria bacterium]|nr:molybdate ABC transporter substrate-binding protein [Deltaproteobacteria bacterium]
MFLRLFVVLLAIFLADSGNLLAGDKIHVAVAANFIQPFKEMAAIFEARSGVQVDATFASSGNIFNQIANGAPYDLFLSADEQRPQLLENNGLAEKPFTYAKGEVVLWSAHETFCEPADWQQALKKSGGRIAVANPRTAPYGQTAMAALEGAGLKPLLESRLVQAQDIAQTFHYATTQAVDAAFCALSAALSEEGKKGCFYRVPEAPPVVQAACVLKNTGQRQAAEAFAVFLVSAEAKTIKKRFGYR